MNSVFQSKVRDLSHKGLGVIDHPDGRIFFVRGTWPGDEGEFEVAESAPKYSEAKLLRLLKLSSERVEVPCSHRGVKEGACGGCPWMLASYQSQIHYKFKRLEHALGKRSVKLEKGVLKKVVPSPETLNYRNRIQLKTNGKKLGYVSEGTSVFAPVDDCLILNPVLHKLFHELKGTLPRMDFHPTDNHKWCYVDLDDEMTISDVVANKRRPFRQGNSDQNEVMRKWVENKFNNIPRHYPVIDLFCGSGNFTEVLSRMGFTNILAVEVQGSALECLRRKNLSGVRVLGLDINQKGAWGLIAKAQPHAKAILIDPPREGITKRRGLYKYLDSLKHIFYISCELDTFSRDIADLARNKWIVEEITPLDLFPHTPHVEMMSSLRLSIKDKVL
ncbi:MAG: class I SAM-dependent RNA methyltransferase [Bacteriovoracia bacterium]